jgi:chromosomal replication initiator protein
LIFSPRFCYLVEPTHASDHVAVVGGSNEPPGGISLSTGSAGSAEDGDGSALEPTSSQARGLWSALLAELRGRGVSAHLQGLLQQLQPREGDHNTLVLSAPNPFIRDWIDDNYGTTLTELLTTSAGPTWRLELRADAPASTAVAPARDVPSPAAARGLNASYTFSSFVLGKSNELVFSAAQGVAKSPGQGNNPLFIYGDSGLGKTHVLHAIGNEILRRNPRSLVRLVNGEQFMNEYIAVTHAGNRTLEKREEFRHKYRKECDLLLLDDIQLWRGSAVETRHEFFLTFNELYESHKQIVITSDRPPSDLPDIEERLKTRFHHGLLADIQPPGFETRLAILQKKADMRKITLPPDVAAFIAERVRRNVRELEGALNRLLAVHDLTRVPISLEMAQHALKNILPPPQVINLDSILQESSRYYGQSVERLVHGGRQKRIAHARAVAMYLCRVLTTASFPEIAGRFEKDHATVMYACRKIEALLAADPATRRECAEIRAQLAL